MGWLDAQTAVDHWILAVHSEVPTSSGYAVRISHQWSIYHSQSWAIRAFMLCEYGSTSLQGPHRHFLRYDCFPGSQFGASAHTLWLDNGGSRDSGEPTRPRAFVTCPAGTRFFPRTSNRGIPVGLPDTPGPQFGGDSSYLLFLQRVALRGPDLLCSAQRPHKSGDEDAVRSSVWHMRDIAKPFISCPCLDGRSRPLPSILCTGLSDFGASYLGTSWYLGSCELALRGAKPESLLGLRRRRSP